MLTVAALVVLRLSLGCHFLYEGVWKIKHADEFSAEPFLSTAKGPLAGFFYAMVPDQYGHKRLEIGEIKDPKTGELVGYVDCDPVVNRWNEIRKNLIATFDPGPAGSEEEKKRYDEFKSRSKEALDQSQAALENYFSDPELVQAVKAYFKSLERFESDPENRQGATFQNERRWNRMMELRAEAKVWIDELQSREQNYLNQLRDQMFDDYRERVTRLPGTWKPWKWTQMQWIDFAVTYGITAIGLCLMLGFFTRLAALGGAAFMCFVVLTQPAWPSIYPPDLPQLGHALLINKDFIEMIALLVISTTAVGRWGGLDHFIHVLIVEPFRARRLKQ
jgi:uncharacterized membrane protein YphA (DoxX/SURF4 family)